MHVFRYEGMELHCTLTTLHKAMPFTGLPGQACTKFWHYTMTDIDNGIQGQDR